MPKKQERLIHIENNSHKNSFSSSRELAETSAYYETLKQNDVEVSGITIDNIT